MIDIIKIACISFNEISHEMFIELNDFIFIDPKIPDFNKEYLITDRLTISTNDSREKIISLITRHSDKSEQALLALYAFRQMDKIDWLPFIKASVERNPVCFTELEGKTAEEVLNILQTLPDDSIYDGKRLALPDEIWNFKRGDGIEKALLLADFLLHNDSSSIVSIEIDLKKVVLTSDGNSFNFISHKNLKKSIHISEKHYEII